MVKWFAGFQSREGSRTQTSCPLSPVLSHQPTWRFKQYLPGSVKVKAGLPRRRWDPKGHYLQRHLCSHVLLSPWRKQNLRKPCRSLLWSLILSLQEALHTKSIFWHVALHVMVQMKPLILSVWDLHQVLHPQEPVLDGFLIRWMVNYRVGLSELSTMDHFFSFLLSLSIYRLSGNRWGFPQMYLLFEMIHAFC